MIAPRHVNWKYSKLGFCLFTINLSTVGNFGRASAGPQPHTAILLSVYTQIFCLHVLALEVLLGFNMLTTSAASAPISDRRLGPKFTFSQLAAIIGEPGEHYFDLTLFFWVQQPTPSS